jgi:hypothetical protein
VKAVALARRQLKASLGGGGGGKDANGATTQIATTIEPAMEYCTVRTGHWPRDQISDEDVESRPRMHC